VIRDRNTNIFTDITLELSHKNSLVHYFVHFRLVNDPITFRLVFAKATL